MAKETLRDNTRRPVFQNKSTYLVVTILTTLLASYSFLLLCEAVGENETLEEENAKLQKQLALNELRGTEQIFFAFFRFMLPENEQEKTVRQPALMRKLDTIESDFYWWLNKYFEHQKKNDVDRANAAKSLADEAYAYWSAAIKVARKAGYEIADPPNGPFIKRMDIPKKHQKPFSRTK